VLDYDNAVIPPKDFFFPQSEKMFSYNTADPQWAIREEEGVPLRALFGARPCDVRSILFLDKVFDAEFRDNYYLDKRNNIGEKYICVDGPVFNLAQIKKLPPEF